MGGTANQQPQPGALQRRDETSPLFAKMAQKADLTTQSFFNTVLATCFPNGQGTMPQVAAFLMVANQYDLNPLLKQLYAFPSKGGGIVPMVPIDGWVTIVQRQPEYGGCEFVYHWDDGSTGEIGPKGTKIAAITTIMTRRPKNAEPYPTKVTEFFSECYRDTEPWKKWPVRMLRWKSYIQCARVAFGITGIYDEDEAERILEGERATPAVDFAAQGQQQPQVASGDNRKVAQDLKERVANARSKVEAAHPAPTTQTPQQATQGPEQGEGGGEEWEGMGEELQDEPPGQEEARPEPADVKPAAQQAPKRNGTPLWRSVPQKPIPFARMREVQESDSDPLFVVKDDGVHLATGTVQKLFDPKAAKNKTTTQAVKMGQFILSTFHRSIIDMWAQFSPEGKICTFAYSLKGDFINIERVDRIGEVEFHEGVPVIQRDREDDAEESGPSGAELFPQKK